MTVKEFEFLNIIKNTLSNSSYIGDDCAYLREFDMVLSMDSLSENTHFLTKYMTPYEIAQKALLSNISDILASGAEPKYALISLGGNLDNSFVEEFYLGINNIALEYDIAIIGGDLIRADKLSVSITVVGDARKRNISSRSHALENYVVAVAGDFGVSAKGLEDLKIGLKDNYSISIHKKPYLQREMSAQIAKIAQLPYAMMDSSDGLFDCLYQIASSSKVDIWLDYGKVPKAVDDKNLILYGGEDYSLVVCLDESDFNNISGLIPVGYCKKRAQDDVSNVFIDEKKTDYRAFEHF